MTCEHARLMHIGGKCNDLSHLKIPHLDIDHDGYMPHLGIIGGSYINLSICMDCGQIQGWKPITDGMVEEDDTIIELRERDEAQREREDERYKLRGGWKNSEAPVILSQLAPNGVRQRVLPPSRKAAIEYLRLEQVLEAEFGKDWAAEPEARVLLIDEVPATDAIAVAIEYLIKAMDRT